MFDPDIPALHVTGFRQTPTEPTCEAGDRVGRVKNPITGNVGCCALDPSGHAAAAIPTSVMNFRRFML
jgi:hypothetical protein